MKVFAALRIAVAETCRAATSRSNATVKGCSTEAKRPAPVPRCFRRSGSQLFLDFQFNGRCGPLLSAGTVIKLVLTRTMSSHQLPARFLAGLGRAPDKVRNGNFCGAQRGRAFVRSCGGRGLGREGLALVTVEIKKLENTEGKMIPLFI